MLKADCEIIANAFQAQGWNKSTELYQQYFAEQQSDERDIFIAEYKNAWIRRIHWIHFLRVDFASM